MRLQGREKVSSPRRFLQLTDPEGWPGSWLLPRGAEYQTEIGQDVQQVGRIGFGPMPARLTPDDKTRAHTGRVAELHRRAVVGLHLFGANHMFNFHFGGRLPTPLPTFDPA